MPMEPIDYTLFLLRAMLVFSFLVADPAITQAHC